MTITDALQLVPEYILLRPGAKLNRGTDEYIEHYAGEEFFHSCDDADADKLALSSANSENTGRRCQV